MDKIKLFLIFSLFAGTVFAYFSVFREYIEFYGMYQTIFRIKNCAIPNPITTPCFYGAFAFLVSLIYSIRIHRHTSENYARHLKYLIYILIGSNIFAWVNNAIIFYKYYTPSDKIGCSGRPIDNPFTTACFIGASIFLTALITALVKYIKMREHKK